MGIYIKPYLTRQQAQFIVDEIFLGIEFAKEYGEDSETYSLNEGILREFRAWGIIPSEDLTNPSDEVLKARMDAAYKKLKQKVDSET